MNEPMTERVYLCFLHECDADLRVVTRALSDMDLEKDRLVLAAVNDPMDEQGLGRQFSDRSFVGLHLSEEVERVARADFEARCQSMLAAGVEKARREGVDAQSIYREGPLVEAAQRIAFDQSAYRIFVPTPPKRLLSRFFKNTSVDALAQSLGVDVVVVD
jgi:hypothetical protein